MKSILIGLMTIGGLILSFILIMSFIFVSLLGLAVLIKVIRYTIEIMKEKEDNKVK